LSRSPRTKKIAEAQSSFLIRKLLAAPIRHDFSRLAHLFKEPVYGGQAIIVEEYLSFSESRWACNCVASIWNSEDAAYLDFMHPPRLPVNKNSDWIFSSLFFAALDDEFDIFPSRFEILIKSICEVCFSLIVHVRHSFDLINVTVDSQLVAYV
jgi:hypothetical protein